MTDIKTSETRVQSRARCRRRIIKARGAHHVPMIQMAAAATESPGMYIGERTWWAMYNVKISEIL